MSKIEKALEWVKDNSGKCRYGEISINVVVHNGLITRIEKSIVEKESMNAQ